MTTFVVGRRAEAVAAEYLRAHSYELIDQNWRTRYCEVDLIAQKAGTIHFVEVKYRANGRHGNGLDYLTQQKLKQMSFAAQLWVAQHGWAGRYQLSAVALAGPDFVVTDFIEMLY